MFSSGWMSDKKNKKGFTLVELVVTGVILLLLLGIGGGSIVRYQQYSNFKKNNDYARTIFSAAQSALSYYKTGGSLDELTEASDVHEVTGGDASILYVEMTKNDYMNVIEANKNTPSAEPLRKNSFYQLLKDYVADKTVFNAAIRIEFQKDNGNVVAVYYCDRVNQLVSGPLQENADDTMGIGNPQDATWDEDRKALYLGYYGAESVKAADVTPVIKPADISSITVENDNLLEATWHLVELNSSPQVKIDKPKNYNYRVQFYDQEGKDLKEEFYFSGKDMSQAVPVKCYSADGSEKDYKSRIYVKDGDVHLLLDAIDLDAPKGDYSIGRISGLDIDEPMLLKVAVFTGEFSEIEKDKQEKPSSVFHPTMYSVHGAVHNINCARHLYNVRFVEKENASNTYFLAKEIDWKDAVDKGEVFNSSGNSAFPSIPSINKDSIFNGNEKQLKNFVFVSDSTLDTVGLFGSSEGTIKNVVLRNTEIADRGSAYTYAGMLCGKNLGTIENVNVQLSSKNQGETPIIVNADYAGGLAGMTCGSITDGYFWGNIKNVQSAGGVTGGLIGMVDQNAVNGIEITDCMSRGNLNSDGSNDIRGGIAGLWQGKDGKVYDCRNRMNVQSGSNTGGIVGAHNANGSTSSTKLLIDKCRNYGKPTEIVETEPIAYDDEFGGILGSRVEKKSTETSITNCYGVSDVMHPITRFTLQTGKDIGPENLVQDENNYYFIEPSNNVELAKIDAPYASWELLSNYFVKGKMVDQSSDTRYEVSTFVVEEKLSITFHFEKICDISDIAIDWYGSSHMYNIEYSIHNGTVANSNNNVLGHNITCNSFINSHKEIRTDLTVDNGNSLQTEALTIQIQNYSDSAWWRGERPGIWEVRFNSKEGNVQNNRNYGAGVALNTRWLNVSGDDGWCGCYTDTTGGRVSGMQFHPHASATNIAIYQKVDKFLYDTEFSGEYSAGGDQSLEVPTGVYFTLGETQINSASENLLVEDAFEKMSLAANVSSNDLNDLDEETGLPKAGSYQMQAGIYASPYDDEPVALLKKEIPEIGENNYILDMEGEDLSKAAYFFNSKDLWDYSGQYYIGINVRKRSNGLTSPWSETFFCKIPTVQLDTPTAYINDSGPIGTTITWDTDPKADYYKLQIPGNDGNTYEMVISTRKDGNGTYNVDFSVNGFSSGIWAIRGESGSTLSIIINDNYDMLLLSRDDIGNGSSQYRLELPYINGTRFMDSFDITALAGSDSRYVDSEVASWDGYLE